MASGLVCVLLFPSWPFVGLIASGWILWADANKRAARLSEADLLRVAVGWILAVMLGNLLMNWGSFQSGFVAGWQAAP